MLSQHAQQHLWSFLRKRTALLITACLVVISLAMHPAAFADYWPGWRGDGSGVSSETRLPHSWSTTANLRWIAAIPGEGLSSPIVWKDRIFLTTAADASDWQGATFVLLALWAVVAPFVLLAYFTGRSTASRQPAPRARLLSRRILLLLMCLAAACFVPIALDHVRACFPTLSVRLTGKPWQFSSVHSHHIRTDDFLAGLLAACVLLRLRPALRKDPALAAMPASPKQRSSAIALLCWLECACIVGLGGTFLIEKTRLFAMFLFAFVILSFLRLLSALRHPLKLGVVPATGPMGYRLLNYFRCVYVLGMAITFLIAIAANVLDNPLFSPLSTWYQIADICCIELIAAVGSFHPRSTARILSISILVPIITLCAFLPLLSHRLEDWWDSLREGRFEVYWAILLVSCLWFIREWLESRSVSVEESVPYVVAPRASYGLVLSGVVFGVCTFVFPPNTVLWRQVLCIDQNAGTLLWKTRCARGGLNSLYAGNSLATPTPVSDGSYVYAHFGDAGTYCLDFAGRVVWWHREPVTPPPYGFSSSPVLWHDLLILTYDLTATSFTLALDKHTGQVRWRACRTELIHPSEKELLEGYSTPMVLEHASGPQLVNHAGYYLAGYDLPSGKELWHFQCPNDAVVVTPVSWQNVVIVGGSRCFQAIQVEHANEGLTTTALWRARRNFPDVPSPVAYGDHVYAITNKGIATCLEASTGIVCWSQRLRGVYDASVIAADGKLFFSNTEGETTVAAAAPEFQLVSHNTVGEAVRASLAISSGRIFIRGDRHLFCIGDNP